MNVIETTSVFLTGAGQLVLQLPNDVYFNCTNYVIRIAQALPSGITANNPVAIQIGSGAVLYDVIRRCGHYLYANQISANRNYVLKVAGDSGVFVVMCGQPLRYNPGTVGSLPAA